LSEYEEKSIIRWYATQDEWGHLAHLAVVKGMTEVMEAPQGKGQTLEKNGISIFLQRHRGLDVKLETQLDRQRALQVIQCS